MSKYDWGFIDGVSLAALEVARRVGVEFIIEQRRRHSGLAYSVLAGTLANTGIVVENGKMILKDEIAWVDGAAGGKLPDVSGVVVVNPLAKD